MHRIFKVYIILGKTFNTWISPIFTGVAILGLRLVVFISQAIDYILFPKLRKPLSKPIIIVGNPRSGTTFLHRYLIQNKFGVGSQLWQMVYPSIVLQKLIKPFLPLLEKISPARHHSTEAHETSLSSVETDDVSLLFRYFDGFFLYGFFLTFDESDLFHWVDPRIRDTTHRDYKWFESMWKRNQISNKGDRYIGKLFSLSGTLPAFQKQNPDAKILYLIRDPLQVIPSGLSLVTGVLDKKFGFWSLDDVIKTRFLNRLYNALVTLLLRFQEDWVNGNIQKENVLIISFPDMMTQFESVMDQITSFVGMDETPQLRESIQTTAENQRQYKSGHKYNLEKFGLTESQIKQDCDPIYSTFLS